MLVNIKNCSQFSIHRIKFIDYYLRMDDMGFFYNFCLLQQI